MYRTGESVQIHITCVYSLCTQADSKIGSEKYKCKGINFNTECQVAVWELCQLTPPTTTPLYTRWLISEGWNQETHSRWTWGCGPYHHPVPCICPNQVRWRGLRMLGPAPKERILQILWAVHIYQGLRLHGGQWPCRSGRVRWTLFFYGRNYGSERSGSWLKSPQQWSIRDRRKDSGLLGNLMPSAPYLCPLKTPYLKMKDTL